MNIIHKNILNKRQKELWPLLSNFKDFYLAENTALALQLGHRKSIDFDLFQNAPINSQKLLKLLNRQDVNHVIVDTKDEFTLIYSGLKLTFLNYPFDLQPNINLETVKSIDSLTIAAMKAYALGRRAKWKDYIDIYFIANLYSLDSIINKSKDIFGNLFSEKFFRTQLCYFKDIDYTEKVEFTKGKEINDERIKNYLKQIAVDI